MGGETARRLSICNQRREAFIHVVLVMTVEERRAGIIGHEVDLSRRVSRHADRILHHSGGGFVPDLRDLEGVPGQHPLVLPIWPPSGALC